LEWTIFCHKFQLEHARQQLDELNHTPRYDVQ
jgi:hypothetical protein